MRLSRLLKTALPLATIATVAPFIGSCSCGGDNYSISYGDNINTINKNADKYQEKKNVVTAIKLKANRETDKNVNLETANSRLKLTINFQNFYYDIIAGATIIHDKNIVLSDWKGTLDSTSASCNLTIDGLFTSAALSGKVAYAKGSSDNYFWLTINNVQICRSYTYQDCKAA